MLGKFNEALKQEINDVQSYIDYLWETGRDNLTDKWIERKIKLTQSIEKIGKEE